MADTAKATIFSAKDAHIAAQEQSASHHTDTQKNSQAPRLEISLPSPSLQLWDTFGNEINPSASKKGKDRILATENTSATSAATAFASSATSHIKTVSEATSITTDVPDHNYQTMSSQVSTVGLSALVSGSISSISPLGAAIPGNAPIVFAKVRADHTARGPDELNVEEEDIVRVLPSPTNGPEKPNMIYGVINGVVGWIPSSSVRMLSEEETFAEGIMSLSDSLSDMSHSLNAASSSALHIQSNETLNSNDASSSQHQPQSSTSSSLQNGAGGPQSASQMAIQNAQAAQTRMWYNKYKAAPRYEKRSFSTSFSVAANEASGGDQSVGSAVASASAVPPLAPIAQLRERSMSGAGFAPPSAEHAVESMASPVGHKTDKSWGGSFIWGGSNTVRERPAPNKVSILGAPAGQRQLWIDFMGGQEAIERLGLSKKEIKRQEVIYEIITTESDYLDDLDLVCEVYIKQLKRNKLIRPKDMAIIFSNIEQLLPVNMELLKSLVKRQSENNHVIEQVGDVFIRVSDYLKMYTMYCSNHPYALIKLQTVRQNKAVAKFLDQCASMPECRNLNLPNFLLKPVQRVCKYPLLLRELIKSTEPDHPDSENLLKALLKIETVVTIINEGARQTENVHKMLELQSRFITRINIVAPSRVMMRNGPVDVRNTQGETKRREVYLFNDMLLVSKPEGDKCKLISMVPFDMIFVNSFHDSSDEHQIEIVHVGNARYYFVFEEAAEKDAWIGAIRSAVEEWLAQKARINMVTMPSKTGQLAGSNSSLPFPAAGAATQSSAPATGINPNVSGAIESAMSNIKATAASTSNLSAPGADDDVVKTHRKATSTMDISGSLVQKYKHSSIERLSGDDSDANSYQRDSEDLEKSSNSKHQSAPPKESLVEALTSTENLAPQPLARRHTSRENLGSNSSINRIDATGSSFQKRIPPPVPEHRPKSGMQKPSQLSAQIQEDSNQGQSTERKTPTGHKPPIFTPSPVALQHQRQRLSLASQSLPRAPPPRGNHLIVQDKRSSETSGPATVTLASDTSSSTNKINDGAHGRAATTEPISSIKQDGARWPSVGSSLAKSTVPEASRSSKESIEAQNDKTGTNGSLSTGSDLRQQRTRSATGGPTLLGSRDKLESTSNTSIATGPSPTASPKQPTPRPRVDSRANSPDATKSNQKPSNIATQSVGSGPSSPSANHALPSATSTTSTSIATPLSSLMRSNTHVSKPVKQAKIIDVRRGPGIGTKAFTYIISVTYVGMLDTQPRVLSRTFDEFFDLHLQLVGHFPEAAGISTGAEIIRSNPVSTVTSPTMPHTPAKRILPELPGQMMFVSESVARSRIVHLQAYVDTLLGLPAKISRSPVILKFFRPT